MSFLLSCPNCGTREVTDFGYGGEVTVRPTSRPDRRELNTYNYFRRNVAGVQREWWFHRSGCRAWFIAERDTTTNEVKFTALPGDEAVGAALAGDEAVGAALAGDEAVGAAPAGDEAVGAALAGEEAVGAALPEDEVAAGEAATPRGSG